ncbi:MAG TPA: four helix bundle protein [Gemmatimonadales bacterium]|nr:four helix bundle protein [Gemmatimonadales bacterium]
MRDHRSLSAWQKANQVTRRVLLASQRHFSPAIRVPFALLQQSVIAVQLHIARGHALRSTKAFRRHLTLAYGSAVEALELLQAMEELHLVPTGELAEAIKGMDEVKGALVALIRQYRHYR